MHPRMALSNLRHPVTTEQHADLAIVGGGIAGLWTLRRVLAAGYNAVLFEAADLGGIQSLASQGMIHGGLKYALAGLLSPASEAIATMPLRWRACMEGKGDVDLSGLSVASDRYYLFAADNTLGKLTTFFASRSLRGRIRKLSVSTYPAAFSEFTGVVYELDDFVIDVPTLVRRLASPVMHRIYHLNVDDRCCRLEDEHVVINTGAHDLHVHKLVNCAGAGAGGLAQSLLPGRFPMQLRPLHQVLVDTEITAPLFAHCLTRISRAEPRLTVTTHEVGGRRILYLGGQLATSGVNRSVNEQIEYTRSELADCLPWISTKNARISTLRIDRAEPTQTAGTRPDQAFVEQEGAWLQAWPTKLTLTPDLGDRVLALLPAPQGGEAPTLDLPKPVFGNPPWAINPPGTTGP